MAVATRTDVVTAPASWYAVKGGNDLYWRVEAPARVLGAKVFAIPEVDATDAILEPNDGPHFAWRETEDGAEYPQHEGTAVWTRPCLARAAHAISMNTQGIRTVAEVDDNYVSDPKHNIFMRLNNFTPTDRIDHLKATASMDGVIFSTKWLRDLYHREYKRFRKRGQPVAELYVARNHVDDRDWPTRIPRSDKLRVGWMGSPSHLWDIDLAYHALRWAADNGCEVYLIGYDPVDPSGAGLKPEHVAAMSAKGQHKIRQWQKVKYTHIPWVEPEKYHRSALPLDIGLCPLLTNAHTSGKSDIKAIEYTINGAAAIVQSNVVYNRTWKHGETALLAGGPEEFLRRLQQLVRDEGLRDRLVANAQQYVREERSLQKNIGEWRDAIIG